MDVCKCIILLRNGYTLNRHRAASPLVRLVEARWEAPVDFYGVLPQNWGGTKPNHTVTYMVLKLLLTTGMHLAFHHDKFRKPRSDTAKQLTLATTTRYLF
ncbi:hypothetical protein TNCV_2685951 [Trichonephila clavipes]|nr:hypothetical protein TNCV_2685951 [Trichonephila clavipes]